MRIRRRLYIFLIFSLCCHLALLAIHLRKDTGALPGKEYAVGQVSRRLSQFAPVSPSVGKIAIDQDSVVNPPLEANPPQGQATFDQTPPVQKPITKAAESAPRAEAFQGNEAPVAPERVSNLGSDEPIDVQLNAGGDGRAVVSPQTVSAGEGENFSGAQPVALVSAQTSAVPRYADNPRPEYPVVARRKGWTGEVRLLVRVDELGRVDRIAVDHSSGYTALDRAARRAVRRWKFVPATEYGLKVASEVVIPIDFRLPASGRSAKLESQ